MKEKRNVHLKVQELCDCYATTDPLREMSVVKDDADSDEGALKWIALAALHGINANAEKISISRSKGGDVRVGVKYRQAELPSPGQAVGEKIFEAVREMTHIEAAKGKIPFSLGIRGSSVDLKIKVKTTDTGDLVTLKFPQ